MKVWIGLFVALFGLAELFQWFRHFTLPLPIFILGGAFLAIASNSDKRTGLPFLSDHFLSDYWANRLSNRLDIPQTPLRSVTPPSPTTTASPSTPSTVQPTSSSPVTKTNKEPTLPNFQSDFSRFTRSISFTIRKSDDDG